MLADRGQERGELLPVLAAGRAGGEGEPQERERRVLMRAAPVAVLAVDDPGLGRVQPQPDLFHPLPERRQHLAGLALGDAVHDRVVGVPLELDAGIVPGEPGVRGYPGYKWHESDMTKVSP